MSGLDRRQVLLGVAAVVALPVIPVIPSEPEVTLDKIGRAWGLPRLEASSSFGGRYVKDAFGDWIERDEDYSKRLTALFLTGNPNS